MHGDDQQGEIVLVDASRRLAEIDRDSLGEACREAEHSLLTPEHGSCPPSRAAVAAGQSTAAAGRLPISP
jgi:hypothetical protein